MKSWNVRDRPRPSCLNIIALLIIVGGCDLMAAGTTADLTAGKSVDTAVGGKRHKIALRGPGIKYGVW